VAIYSAPKQSMDMYGSVTPQEKIDFTKKFPDLYNAIEGEVALVEVPPLKFIVSEGVWVESTGEQFDNAFKDVHTFMCGLAFSMKFRLKRMEHEDFKDYHMPPIAANWKKEGVEKKTWKWKLMLLQPNCISDTMFKKTVEIAKIKQQDKLLPIVDLEKINAGSCLQTLHVGPYTDVQQSVDLIEKYAMKNGYKIIGDHHEIYLNDKRRTKPDKLNTIIRYKVQKV